MADAVPVCVVHYVICAGKVTEFGSADDGEALVFLDVVDGFENGFDAEMDVYPDDSNDQYGLCKDQEHYADERPSGFALKTLLRLERAVLQFLEAVVQILADLVLLVVVIRIVDHLHCKFDLFGRRQFCILIL